MGPSAMCFHVCTLRARHENGTGAGYVYPTTPAFSWISWGATILWAAATCLNASALDRPMDPVILTGSQTPSLMGLAPGDIAAFRYEGEWRQIPVQVDERAIIDFTDVYNGNWFFGDFRRLDYVDAGTHTGPDPDPALDADDEIVFMAKDAGARNTEPISLPDHVRYGTGVEITITDPLGGEPGYVYLFRHDGTLDPGAGAQYVNYNFNLLSGDYKTTYAIPGPNPEDTTITTPYYQWHFCDRWKSDGLRIFAGSATGVNILDRHKNLFAPGKCTRSEDTFCEGEGAFVANRAGPIRVIRNYVGANSGPRTQRQNIFYEQQQIITTWLRVHSIDSVLDFFDYSPAAQGMTYSNNNLPSGVVIDGVPDVAPPGPLRWEMVSGPQGTLVMWHLFETDIAGYVPTSYYLDDAAPTVRQCTGDAYAFGSSGHWFDQFIPNTDPYLVYYSLFSLSRRIYFLPPDASVADAQFLANKAERPLNITAAAWNPEELANMPASTSQGLAALIAAILLMAPSLLPQRVRSRIRP